MTYTIKQFKAGATLTAADLNNFRTNLNTHLKQHAHTGVAGDGSNFSTFAFGGDYFQAIASDGFGLTTGSAYGTPTYVSDATAEFGSYPDCLNASSSANNYVGFYVCLRGGTYTLSVLYRKDSDYGISTISVGAVSVGTTIDFYAAGASVNNETTITGIVIPNQAYNTRMLLKFLQTTKNASSSGYGCGLQFVALIRTGD